MSGVGTAHSWSEARSEANGERRAIQDIHNTWGTTIGRATSVAILFLSIVSTSVFHPPTSGYWVPECPVSTSPNDKRESGEAATDHVLLEHCKGTLRIAARSLASYAYE